MRCVRKVAPRRIRIQRGEEEVNLRNLRRHVVGGFIGFTPLFLMGCAVRPTLPSTPERIYTPGRTLSSPQMRVFGPVDGKYSLTARFSDKDVEGWNGLCSYAVWSYGDGESSGNESTLCEAPRPVYQILHRYHTCGEFAPILHLYVGRVEISRAIGSLRLCSEEE